MRLFGHMVVLSIKRTMTYRTALIAGFVTNLFFGILKASVLVAFYAGSTSVNGLSMNGAITFVGFSQAMIPFLKVFGSSELMRTVYTGKVGSDLLKPVHPYIYWLANDLGDALVNLVGRGILFLVVFRIFFPLDLPQSIQGWLFFGISLALGWLVCFALRFLANLTAFWSPDARGIIRMIFALVQTMSGFLIPLRLFPDWFRQICEMTPFASIINAPMEVYLGILQGTDLLKALAIQGFWFIGLTGLCLWALQAGMKRLVVQGG
jgi:ABC-2 type transport system permease protein